MTIKLYDNDAYQKECQSVIISADKITRPDKEQTKEHSELLDLVLDQTVFFPEEGGQTPDRGTISVADSDGNTHFFDVIDVQIKNEIIHHYVSADADADARLLSGIAVICSIDWQHRFDNMQNHSRRAYLLRSGAFHVRL